MREIKFRCWFDNKMFKVFDIDFLFKGINLFGADIVSFDDGILMQYTGLKDKNGKEIYEGDIVRSVSYHYSNDEFGHKGFYETLSKIVYRGRAFQYEWIRTNEIDMPENFKESYEEVIGNIYDNSELLEVEQ